MLVAALLPLTSLANARLQGVRAARAADVARLLASAGVNGRVDTVYLRAFKEERLVELWAGGATGPLSLVKAYPICAASGELGPKRREGDLQVPEGLYDIVEFNPASNFHLSMKVSYPNASDRLRSDPKRPGDLIYLHGSCASIGCIAIEDGPIEEVFLIASGSRARPRIDVFPARLTAAWLAAHASAPHAGFWAELAPAFAWFERTRRPAPFSVDQTGAYRVSKSR
ncbi:MAG: L,D-transpeptidase family protein [Myxococcaceae bacterium]|nr:L,D-transpeptidase family protein [Myxococcaceae bacterium]MCA3016315.1 L,D-transpeptidase family protein [Myxococcaceae bacterium]